MTMTTMARSLSRVGILALLATAASAWGAWQVDGANGTVTDDVTGLMWDQSIFAGTACVNGEIEELSTKFYNWSPALQTAVTANVCHYKGHSDWRLPNIQELGSLIDWSRSNPAIDSGAFPDTPVGRFWSSTSQISSGTHAWNVGFFDGTVDTAPISNVSAYRYQVRLVRGGRDLASSDLLDTVAPIVTGPTATPGTNGSTASAEVTANENASGYWLALPATTAAPVASEVRASTNAVVAMTQDVLASFSIVGLQPDTVYVLYFLAEDANANQSDVALTPFTTPARPSAPTHVQAVAGNGQIELSWEAPVSDGGSAITGYAVTMNGAPLTGCNVSPCTIAGLNNGTSYAFMVAAVNEVGSTSAEPVSASPMAPLPVAPTPVPTQSARALAVMGLLIALLAWRLGGSWALTGGVGRRRG